MANVILLSSDFLGVQFQSCDELIVTLSESVKNKAEMLNIPRKTIRHSGDFDANWQEKEPHK